MASFDEQTLSALREKAKEDGFAVLSGIRLLEITPRGAVGEMRLGPEHRNSNGGIHGGALYTLADMVGGAVAYTSGQRRGAGTSCVTTSSSFYFFRPVRDSERLIGRATLRKEGRTLVVVDVSVEDEDGNEICGGSLSYCPIDLEAYRQKG